MRQHIAALDRLRWALGILLLVSAAACDGPNYPLNAPTAVGVAPASVTLQVLPTDTRTELRAFVRAIDRSPVSGARVHFAASNGDVTPTDVLADSAGVARTVWTGLGDATVMAVAGQASATASVSYRLAPLDILLSVTPLVRYQPGTFTARVLDITAPATYAWTFGDGATATTGTNTVTHAYQNDDATLASVVVTDAAGRTGTGTVNLVIAQPPH